MSSSVQTRSSARRSSSSEGSQDEGYVFAQLPPTRRRRGGAVPPPPPPPPPPPIQETEPAFGGLDPLQPPPPPGALLHDTPELRDAGVQTEFEEWFLTLRTQPNKHNRHRDLIRLNVTAAMSEDRLSKCILQASGWDIVEKDAFVAVSGVCYECFQPDLVLMGSPCTGPVP